MHRLFADLPEALANTVHVASRLDFKLDELGYKFPTYDVGPNDTMDTYLRKRVLWKALQIVTAPRTIPSSTQKPSSR